MPSGLEIAGRCVPTSGHLIGGDWYDVIPLPDDRTGLVVGDVMGHGPEAAAVMAQLRAAAHALADLDLAPADLLWRLNRWSGTLDRITLATCAYAVIDPAGQSCVLAGAGHLPPVLALPDGTTRVADLPAGQSLGLGPASYGEAHIKLPAGAILALYTDGLVGNPHALVRGRHSRAPVAAGRGNTGRWSRWPTPSSPRSPGATKTTSRWSWLASPQATRADRPRP